MPHRTRPPSEGTREQGAGVSSSVGTPVPVAGGSGTEAVQHERVERLCSMALPRVKATVRYFLYIIGAWQAV